MSDPSLHCGPLLIVAGPGFDAETCIPVLPESDGTNTQLYDLKLLSKLIALSNCCSATAHSLKSATKERHRAWKGLIL